MQTGAPANVFTRDPISAQQHLLLDKHRHLTHNPNELERPNFPGYIASLGRSAYASTDMTLGHGPRRGGDGQGDAQL